LRQQRQHMRANPASQEWRYGLARRLLAWVGSHPVGALTAVVLLYIVTATAGWVIPAPSWAPAGLAMVQDKYRDLQGVDLALLGAQATLLGLVYPLVIALVGLMFSSSGGPAGRLKVYFRETEAAIVGAIALGLLVAIGLQCLFFSVLPQNVLVCVTALDILWFVVNLLNLGFFVARSLDFAQPTRRQLLVRSYLANTAWPHEFYTALLAHRWFGAATYGDLPARGEQGVWDFMLFDRAPPLAERRLPRPSILANVQLGWLKAVLTQASPEHPLHFTALVGRRYDGLVPLCRSSEPAEAWPWLGRALLRQAFVFDPIRPGSEPPTTAGILAEATAELTALFDAGRVDAFDALLDETVELHGMLYGLAQGKPGSTEFGGNASALEVPRGMGNSIAREWARAYIILIQRIGDRLTAEGRFLGLCAHLTGRLLRHAKAVPYDAVDPLFYLPGVLFSALVEGAVRRRTESLSAPVPRGQLFTPAGPGADFYRAAWRDLVGGWESVGSEVADGLDKLDWARTSDRVPFLKRHLWETALRVAQAAKAGERQAIGWTVDMMLKWRGHLRLRLSTVTGFALHRPLVTLALLSRPWTEVSALPLTLPGHAVSPQEIIGAAFENAWLDALVVLTTSLIALGDASDPALALDSGPMEAAAALIANQSFDPGAGGQPYEAPLTVAGVVASVLRLEGAGPLADAAEGSGMSGLGEAIDRLEGPAYVSARIYSFSGSVGSLAQAQAQSLLLLALVQGAPGHFLTQGVTPELRGLLLPPDDRRKRRLRNELRSLKAAVEGLDPGTAPAIVGCLRRAGSDAAELAGRQASIVSLLAACEAEIDAARLEAIKAARIDRQRLRAVAEAASTSAFAQATGPFPVWAFGAVNRVEAPLTSYLWRHGTLRGLYTTPLMDEEGADTPGYWDPPTRDTVAHVVFHDVIQAAMPELRTPETPLDYWGALKEALDAVRGTGQEPIVAIIRGAEPRVFFGWRYNQGEPPADAVFSHVAGRGDGYEYDINGAPVFHASAAGNATWVFGRKVFGQLDFRRFMSGLPVDVGFEDDSADPWKGSLIITFERRVGLGDGPVWRIVHPPVQLPGATGNSMPAD
jgi:hypothetical protein